MTINRDEPIAVIGSAFRFAGGIDSESKLADLLEFPRDLRQEIPESRFNIDGFYHHNGSHHGHTNVRHGYFLENDISAFDAGFFGIKAAESRAVDPQQRMLLEVAFEALESAGLPVPSLRGSDTAIYVGCMVSDYSTLQLRDLQEAPTYFATGVGASILSNRLSYFFDWHGPSVTLDTACSSSLTAVHLAAQALRAGESRVALVGGTNLILGPENFIIESKLSMLSPDGQCRMWDQEANGYARGEGVATLVLKKLSAAIEDGDHIECLIRATGLNQDGASAGITMPNSSAQETLIRSVYEKAGLNPLSCHDRPQYFEAHGTGTRAGDPQEAEAIYRAFHRVTESGSDFDGPVPMYVGSVKTVLGHTEGTAGIAGILKVSMAMRRGIIPPNLLFNQLSDGVAPFYKDVEILQEAKPWPETTDGRKRASVNSFGFGGTNAHAIVESYHEPTSSSMAQPMTTPFLFSATSPSLLRSTLSNYLTYLQAVGPDVDAQDLAWTLCQRRTLFQHRVSYTASGLEDLRDQVAEQLQNESAVIGVQVSNTPSKKRHKILGVFTGQGAQYARMAAELVEKSDWCQAVIERLELSLSTLPDGPQWSLTKELLAGTSTRIDEAAMAQPLCTAVQILLLDLLKVANISLDVVVGHSSGEIAAAYATGILTAHDAIRVAYYRGLHLSAAASPNGAGIRGAMLAVGGSIEEILPLCSDEQFAGRVCIGASNSSSSVTLSGDEGAINELKMLFDNEGRFNRKLKVDKAYHSNHMLPCYQAYINSLLQCSIKPLTPSGAVSWVSSVYNQPVDLAMDLGGKYWAENMTQSVFFDQALTTAMTREACDLALEIGPHPALKSPAAQTIQSVLDKDLPYHGLLHRGTDAVRSFSTALGFLLTYLDPGSVSMDAYERAITGEGRQNRLVDGLPPHQWDHSQKYWAESRTSRKLRLRKRLFHCLLGNATPDSARHHMAWRNLLVVKELPWVEGHQVQGQIVFPAAGYLTTALEASVVLAESYDTQARLVELKNFIINQPITLDENDDGVEVLIELANVSRQLQQIRAHFTYSAALGTKTEDLSLVASCEVYLTTGEASTSLLPSRALPLSNLIDVDTTRFYSSLSDLGYDFSDRFQSLSKLQRKYQRATCWATMRPLDEDDGNLLIHPAEMDSILQSILLAQSYPRDGQLPTIHLPTSFAHIRINPALLKCVDREAVSCLPVDCQLISARYGHKGVTGHISLYSHQYSHAAIQIQGANYMPLGGVSTAEDRRVFSKMHWVASAMDGAAAAFDIPLGEAQVEKVKVLERIATFYLRMFDQEVPPGSSLRSEFPTNWYLNYARHVTSMVETDAHPWAQKEWLSDTIDDIRAVGLEYADTPDVQIMHLVGEQMPRVFRGETTILEQLRANDILDRYYAEGIGLPESGKWVGKSVKQLTDINPRMRILEVGAGTGGATKAIFREIGSSFASYTYTDISAAFFENASTRFAQHRDRMFFKTFDAEKDPSPQGFLEHSYDLVVAFFVIHAASDLERALRNIRKLLKPGGHLVVGEGQEGQNGVASGGFIFGTLPGWWLGVDHGRVLSPHVSPQEWDEVLKKAGFSGLDSTTPEPFREVLNVFHFSSQAIDERVGLFRQPLLSLLARNSPIQHLVLVGGRTIRSSCLLEGVQAILTDGFADTIQRFDSIESIDFEAVDSRSTILNLSELDTPILKNITPVAFEALKRLLGIGHNLICITSGRLDNEPFSNMLVGFGRTAQIETSGLRLQQIDVADPISLHPTTLAEMILRFHFAKPGDADLSNALETEIVIDKTGRQLVSRLKPEPTLNDRYNSGTHEVVRETNAMNRRLIVKHEANGFKIRELSPSFEASPSTNGSLLNTLYSTTFAIRTLAGYCFLNYAVDSSTSSPYVVLSPERTSIHDSGICSAVAVPVTKHASPMELLALVFSELVASAILERTCAGQVLLVHNAGLLIAEALGRQSGSRGFRTIFSTDQTDRSYPESWIQLPQYASEADVDDILAAEPTLFTDLSTWPNKHSENEALLRSRLPDNCLILTAKDLFSSHGTSSSTIVLTASRAVLHYATVNVLENSRAGRDVLKIAEASSVLKLADLPGLSDTLEHLSLIYWTNPTAVPLTVTRLDAEPMFRGRGATYWVVGMTGALGTSLVDWMISKGARNIAMTSRNPQIAPEWLSLHQRRGARVKIFACDISDESSLRVVYDEIVDSCPPIAGVINGAMVLRDASIPEMTYEDLTIVLAPKATGSLNLDRIFEKANLDFFVLVSSINCVLGYPGQSNYTAANAFMCALAAQRRKRGYRAAAVNIGAIVGAGFMERASSRALDQIVQKLAVMRLSEEDWHQAICEAIHACRLDAPAGSEITVGMSEVPFDTPNPPYWFADPRFAEFVRLQKTQDSDGGQQKITMVSVKDQLRDCSTRETCHAIVEETFASLLRKILQTSTPTTALMTSAGTEIGLDSLVSVDIRNWLMKNLEVSVPVLKIVSNSCIADIVQYVVDNLPSKLIPQVKIASAPQSFPASSRDDASGQISSCTPNTGSVALDGIMGSSQLNLGNAMEGTKVKDQTLS